MGKDRLQPAPDACIAWEQPGLKLMERPQLPVEMVTGEAAGFVTHQAFAPMATARNSINAAARTPANLVMAGRRRALAAAGTMGSRDGAAGTLRDPRASPWRVRASTGRNAHGGCRRLVRGELPRGVSTGRRWRSLRRNSNTRTKGRRVAYARLRDRAPRRRGRVHAPSAIRCLRTRRRSGNRRTCTPPISPDAHSHRRLPFHDCMSALSIAVRPGQGVADHRVGDSLRARRVPVSPRLT